MPGATIVAHNDLAPYNLCFDGDELVGVFDWDVAGPSTPTFELAHIAWTAVPLFRDVEPVAAAHRLTLLTRSYAAEPGRDDARGPSPAQRWHHTPSAAEILAAVPVRVRQQIDGIRLAAAAGDTGMRQLMAVADEPERTERAWASFTPHLPAIATVLRAGPE